MKAKYILSAAALSFALFVQAQQINPITQAMLDGYASLLEKNPDDYLTLYDRAAQYYRLSNYEAALFDIKKSIAHTPTKEKDQLASSYSLCADIYTEMKQYPEAREAIYEALKIDPASYPLLYSLGNVSLHLKDYDQASKAYKSMQRINPRSTEALFGLAMVAVAEGKTADAHELMKEIEKLDSSNYLTYCRLGDLSRDMNEIQAATTNYLNAFSLSSNSSRPMASLMEVAAIDYPAFQQAIDFALSRTKNVVPLHFISGNASLAAGKYGDAYSTFRTLISIPKIDSESLLPILGEVCLLRGDLNEADNYINQAMQSSKDNELNLLKAKIENARGNHASALIFAQNYLQTNDGSVDGRLEYAAAALAKQDDADAVSALNQAILYNPADMRPLLVRGYLQSKGRAGGKQSLTDFSRVGAMPADTDAEIAYKAIAQALGGNIIDAESTITPLKAKAAKNPEAAYLYALYLHNAGNEAEAQAALDTAKNLGYENEYMLKYFALPIISLNHK